MRRALAGITLAIIAFLTVPSGAAWADGVQPITTGTTVAPAPGVTTAAAPTAPDTDAVICPPSGVTPNSGGFGRCTAGETVNDSTKPTTPTDDDEGAVSPDDTTGTTAGTTGTAAATGRSQTFFTGPVDPSKVNATDYGLWYVQDEDKVKVLGATVANFDDAGDKIWGQGSDFLFTAYKYGIHWTLGIVGGVVFSLAILTALILPARNLATSFKTDIIGPFQLVSIALAAIAVGFIGPYLKRNWQKITKDYIVGVIFLVLLLGTIITPDSIFNWCINFAAVVAAGILLVGAGKDPGTLPAPTGGAIDTTVLSGAYDTLTSALEQLLVGNIAQLLMFGQMLPKACEAPFMQAVAQRNVADDPANFTPMQAIAECRPFVQSAMQPDSERFFFTILLAVWAIVFAALVTYVAWPAIKGQLTSVVTLVIYPFLLLAASVPYFRPKAAAFGKKFLMGLVAIITFSFWLVATLIFMTTLLTVTLPPIFSTWVRLVCMLAVPIALAVLETKGSKDLNATVNAKSEGGIPTKPDIRSRASQMAVGAVSVAGGAALTKGTAMLKTGASSAVGGTASAVRTAAFGNDKRAGVFTGPTTATKTGPVVKSTVTPTGQRAAATPEMPTEDATEATAATRASQATAAAGTARDEALRAHVGLSHAADQAASTITSTTPSRASNPFRRTTFVERAGTGLLAKGTVGAARKTRDAAAYIWTDAADATRKSIERETERLNDLRKKSEERTRKVAERDAAARRRDVEDRARQDALAGRS